MTRTIIAIASALLAAMSLFASAAEACISCEYVPPVVNSSSKSHSEERSTPRRENRTREVRESRENKKSRVTETAKSEKADKVQKTQKAEVEKVTPAASTAQVENSSVALVTTAHEAVPAKSETPGDRGMEPSTIATATSGRDKPAGAVEAANAGDKVSSGEPTAAHPVTCSRYFPSAAQTLTVPCE